MMVTKRPRHGGFAAMIQAKLGRHPGKAWMMRAKPACHPIFAWTSWRLCRHDVGFARMSSDLRLDVMAAKPP
jgi:hypothetical protein